MRVNCLRKFVTGMRLAEYGFGVLVGVMLKSVFEGMNTYPRDTVSIPVSSSSPVPTDIAIGFMTPPTQTTTVTPMQYLEQVPIRLFQ